MDAVSIIFIVVILCFLYKKKVARSNRPQESFLPVYGYLTGANDRLYRLLQVVKDLFEKKGIPFVISGAALLSAVEKQRLARGQSQATILIQQDYVDALLSLTDDFVRLGLGLTDLRDGGYRLSSAVNLPVVTDTAIVIFPVQLVGDRWITNSKYHGYNEWYGAKDLFPAKTYQLGLLDIPGPADPIDYLQRNYWSLGIRATDFPKKSWYQISPSFYGTNMIPIISDIDYVNGIRNDPRPLPGKTTVLLGNGRTAVIPNIGPQVGRWRRFLWT